MSSFKFTQITNGAHVLFTFVFKMQGRRVARRWSSYVECYLPARLISLISYMRNGFKTIHDKHTEIKRVRISYWPWDNYNYKLLSHPFPISALSALLTKKYKIKENKPNELPILDRIQVTRFWRLIIIRLDHRTQFFWLYSMAV